MKLDDIRQRCEAAASGPWEVKTNAHRETSGEAWGWIDGPFDNWCWSNKHHRSKANAEFVAAAREDIPYLLSLVDELTAEVEQLREGQRWIPVSERLPETANSVLIRVAHPGQAMKGFTDIACYSRDKKHPQFSGWYFNDREKVESDVTHWMPLPAPPEGE